MAEALLQVSSAAFVKPTRVHRPEWASESTLQLQDRLLQGKVGINWISSASAVNIQGSQVILYSIFVVNLSPKKNLLLS